MRNLNKVKLALEHAQEIIKYIPTEALGGIIIDGEPAHPVLVELQYELSEALKTLNHENIEDTVVLVEYIRSMQQTFERKGYVYKGYTFNMSECEKLLWAYCESYRAKIPTSCKGCTRPKIGRDCVCQTCSRNWKDNFINKEL